MFSLDGEASPVIKVVYFVVTLAILAPSIVGGVGALVALRTAHRIYVEEQRRTSGSIYVTAQTFALRVGHRDVPLYPRLWPAVLMLFGSAFWLVGAFVLFFVRL